MSQILIVLIVNVNNKNNNEGRLTLECSSALDITQCGRWMAALDAHRLGVGSGWQCPPGRGTTCKQRPLSLINAGGVPMDRSQLVDASFAKKHRSFGNRSRHDGCEDKKWV